MDFARYLRHSPTTSRIAEIQTNNQSSSSSPTVSIPPCKPGSASLNQFSVCRWVLTSRWIIPSIQATETTKHFLPSFLPCCMISSVEYKDSTFTLTLLHFLSSSHSIHSKIKRKTDSHIHIVFSPNNSTLLFILSKYFSFHSIHSFTHSFIHSLTHSLTHSFIHSLIHSLTHSLTHSLICLLNDNGIFNISQFISSIVH